LFNKESPTVCTYIYSHSFFFFGSHSYMHCGKATGRICETNEECTSIDCAKDSDCENSLNKLNLMTFIKY